LGFFLKLRTSTSRTCERTSRRGPISNTDRELRTRHDRPPNCAFTQHARPRVAHRYQNYDSTTLGTLVHQLCTAHLLRDLADAAQVYPDAIWPVQIADALRELIHHANQAREQGHDTIAVDVREELLRRLRNGRAVGLSDTTSHGTRPGERKARLLLEVLRDREGDVLRFVDDLQVPPTSNQAERDLRPSKIQQKISGRLTSEERTQDRYIILGYVSTAAKHGIDKITALRDALTGRPWMPALPVPT
jgi:hypothetical protein